MISNHSMTLFANINIATTLIYGKYVPVKHTHVTAQIERNYGFKFELEVHVSGKSI